MEITPQPDVLVLISLEFDDFKTLRMASMTCKNWRKIYEKVLRKLVYRDTLPDFWDTVYFKITKLRFLHRNGDGSPGREPTVHIYDRWWKNTLEFKLHPVRNDKDYTVYESDACVILRLKTLRWRMSGCWATEKTEGTQIVPSDLNISMFQTGNEYKQPEDQFVIGSIGMDEGWACCCGIKLIP